MSWLIVLGWLKRIPWQVYVIAALLSITAVLVLTYGHSRYNAGQAGVQARWDQQEAAYAVQRAEAAETARKVEERHRAEYRAIAERFLADQKKADEKYQADVDRLRAGSLRLRDRFTCPSLPGAATDPGGVDPAGPRGLQREDQEFLLRIGREADEVARRLNALIEAVKAGER